MAAFGVLLFLAAAVALAASGPTPETFDFARSVNNFAVKFHKVAAQEAGNKNLIASPVAIQLLLSLYAAGTEGELRSELLESLNLGDFDKVVQRFGSESHRLSSYNPDTLTLANRIYTRPQPSTAKSTPATPLSEQFYRATQAYNADVEQLDFTDQAKAVETINRWVAEKSHQHIKKAVSAGDVPANTALALLNVIYFQGKWSVPFKASKTEEGDFFVAHNSTVKKQMMHLRQSFHYHDCVQHLGAEVLELPYQEDGFRMVVILPKAVDGLPGVLQKLSEQGLDDTLESLYPYPAEIDLKMPKFEIENKLDLNALLPKVGVSKVFTHPASKLLAQETVVVEKALQKAFVKVNEEGATAGAFSGMFPVPMSSNWKPPPPIDFHVDRPFFFAILDRNTALFTGTYVL